MSNQHRLRPIRVLDVPRGAEYDEETFRYFLAIEQARATRANKPLRLLLASVQTSDGQAAPLSPPASGRLFDAMHDALRDTDVVGWYQQDRVAAAVLTVPSGTAGEQGDQLEKRVVDGVKRRLPARLAGRLKVRIVQRELAERGTA